MTVTVTTDTDTAPGYTIVAFTGSGAFDWECPLGVTVIAYLLVGGGGGGRGYIAYVYGKGGGGGGEVLTGTMSVTPGNSLSGVVGAGGAENKDGIASVLGNITARPGLQGPNTSGGASGNGNAGGSINNTYWGGGGGGAGAAGSNAVGGIGVSSDITGADTYYGGGGGGGTQAFGFGGPGGLGGGGTGGIQGVSNATAGTDGFGGGGGGGYWDGSPGAKGGDGIVVIKYTNPVKSSKQPRNIQPHMTASPALNNLSLDGSDIGSILFGVA